MEKAKTTRKRRVNVSDERLAECRELWNENPSPIVAMLRAMDDDAAKRIIQSTENKAEQTSDKVLKDDADYQAARKLFDSARNTWYRAKSRMVVDENTGIDGFQARINALQAKIDEIINARETAAADTADGTDPNVPEGVLHRNMREARERKRALARKALGLNGTDAPTPEDALTDGEV